jgi:diacylglycerol kinase
MAVAVVAAAAALGASLVEWCILILCVAVVLAAELFNTALEHLGRAVTDQENEHVRDALDTAAGAVLVAAVGAAVVGSVIFAHRLAAAAGAW